MNNYFACDTLQWGKPSTQFDVDPVRYIVRCEDIDVNHYIAIHQVQDKTKELNYDTLQQSVDKPSINNYLWVNSSQVDDTRIAVSFLPPAFVRDNVISDGQMY
eukprot:2188292-Ditylum_brightwellii.AAC.1